MWRAFRNKIGFIIVVVVIWFYWIAKQPANFSGVTFPDFIMPLFAILALFGSYSVITNGLRYKKSELFFSLFLVLVPFVGLWGNFFGMPLSSEWNWYIDATRSGLVGDIFSTFRPYLFLSVIFLFASHPVAKLLNRKNLELAVIIGIIPHIIWGFSQVLYIFYPFLLDSLPIKVGEMVGLNFNLNILRATGLTTNPFYFSFLLLVAALVIDLFGKNKICSLILLLLSWLSISRSFMLVSIPAITRHIRLLKLRQRIYFLLTVLFCSVLFINTFVEILKLRFTSDGGIESRASTNLLAWNSFIKGNLLGIGFDNPYYTDSTVASLLLGGGALAVSFYFLAWGSFFISFWNVSEKNFAVLLFGFIFFSSIFLVGSPEAQPGLFVLFVTYWMTRFERENEQKRLLNKEIIGNCKSCVR